MNDDLIGRNLDGYEIGRMLGSGGMGAVYEAVEVVTGERVAIKIRSKRLGQNTTEEDRRRFEREASVAAAINHPNVARVLANGSFQDLDYLVMEYIDGRPLNQVLKEEVRLPGKKCLDLILQTARGLQAAYECGSIHRDIKPENLMMTQDGRIKIVDFGLAKNEKIDSFKTATGVVMGTPHYISPEQASGLAVDHRSDIYSLGATLYHLLAGRPPFDGDNAFSILHKQVHEEVRSLIQWNPGVPEAVCQLVYRMLAKHPDARFQTYGHLIRVLEDLLSGRDRPSLTMEAVDEERLRADRERARQDRRRLMVMGAALALGLAVAFGFMIGRAPQEPAAPAAADAAPTRVIEPEKWKSTTMPLLQDIRTQINELDEDERNFSRRARNATDAEP